MAESGIPQDELPFVDSGDIKSFVGRAAYERGRAYATEGRVTDVGFDSTVAKLSGRIAGSGSRPYVTHVTLDPTTGRGRTATHVPLSSVCSCPVGSACKHAAALLVHTNLLALEQSLARATRMPSQSAQGTASEDGGGGADSPGRVYVTDASGGVGGADSGEGSAGPGGALAEGRQDAIDHLARVLAGRADEEAEPRLPEATDDVDRSRPASSWRTALSVVSRSHEQGFQPLGLGFELRARPQRSWWDRSKPEHLTPADLAAGVPFSLLLRPIERSTAKTGGWIKGGLTWRQFLHLDGSGRHDRRHAELFSQFTALQNAGRLGEVGEPDTIALDGFSSPLLWHLLDQARRLGIAFIGMGHVATVAIGTRADAVLDVHQDSPTAVLRVEPVVTIDGDRFTATRPIGQRGFYAVEPSEMSGTGFGMTGRKSSKGTGAGGIDLVLAPTAEPLSPEFRHFLQNTRAVEIPPEDTEEFLHGWFPRLQSTVNVTSTDRSVKLPEYVPPDLHLRARYTAKDRKDGTVLDRLSLTWSWHYHDPDRTLEIGFQPGERRDTVREKEVLEAARAVWEAAATRPQHDLEGIEVAEFTERVLPELEKVPGLVVDVEGERKEYQELSGTPNVRVSAAGTDDNDWFDLGFEVTIDGKNIPFSVLFAALAQGRTKLMLVDRTYFSLEHPAFDKLRALIAEATAMGEWEPEQPQINRYQLAVWEDLEDLADEAVATEEWTHSLEALRSFDGLPETPVPAGLQADLRPYQITGFRWLAFLAENHLGGILADDMGLGKTVQTLALVAHMRQRAAEAPAESETEAPAESETEAPGASVEQGADAPEGRASGAPPFLVVAPTSVVANWKLEAAKFTPDLDVRVLDTTSRKRGASLAEETAGADLVVTSYAILRIDAEEFAETPWAGLVLDEAQFVKNRTSKVHLAAKGVKAPFRLAITGTPMENSLSDLWSLAAITAPGLFPSFARFKQEYILHIEGTDKEGAGERMARLRSRIRPFMMRRTKDLVAADLPEKQEQVTTVELVPKHRKLYDQVLQRERKKVLGILDEDMERAKFIVFRSLTLLRMMALDPAIVDPEHEGIPSSKLEALLVHLEEILAEGHRTLVFSQFTSFLGRVADRLDDQGIPYAYLDGSTRDRARVIEEFKSGEAPVFLISLKAGGFGLTLTEADYVFLLDPWWNPAAESQAIDRTHRIGQTKNVMVYRLVAEDTIEQKVLALQQKKAEIFDALMDEGATFSQAITADDLRGLFEN
ncbi:SNF2-related protein [Brevibacterium samyangense]|uniref:DEAD/DEAH box helicase n=1 Tax=Brevibacterium samyangense TaxID=366888 RepID=A0ABP5F1J2_9MICO